MISAKTRRGAFAWLLLLVLVGAELSSAPLREVPALVSRAVSLAEKRAALGAVSWFDPAYFEFVEAVRRATPEHATISLVVPRTTDLYVYRAVYGLVPRRVVGPEEWKGSDYVAVYGSAASLSIPAGRPIPGGTLLAR